jgi:hypothetical protein
MVAVMPRRVKYPPAESHEPVPTHPIVLPVSSLGVMFPAIALESEQTIGPREVENAHLTVFIEHG